MLQCTEFSCSNGHQRERRQPSGTTIAHMEVPFLKLVEGFFGNQTVIEQQLELIVWSERHGRSGGFLAEVVQRQRRVSPSHEGAARR